MSDHPLLSTQLIGETESALGALLAPLLAEAGLTFLQWVALSVAAAGAASGTGIARDELTARIAGARKVAAADAAAAVSELERTAALAAEDGQLTLTDAGQATYGKIRTRVQRITGYVFDLPAEDLAAGGRILAAITARANAVLADTGLAGTGSVGR
jgi:hypothetical protein